MKTFTVFNLGCRVNAAETNLFAQSFINCGYTPSQENPDIIFINTCSITKKADIESTGLIRRLRKKHPQAEIIISGCANLKDISTLPDVTILNNAQKEKYLDNLNCAYTHQVLDKFSYTHRFLLKVQSGCTAFCSYCTVPQKRHYLWSLPINIAIDTVNKAVSDGYQEIIITGVNLNQYLPGFSNLVEALLTQTKIPLISFGSIPINCIDEKFINLLSAFPFRLSTFIHIPLQSGSDKILKLMNRNYTKKIILEKFSSLKNLESHLSFGTDLIVGFPGESDVDFQETYKLCQQIAFSKIHVFRYSPRPNTNARKLFLESDKLSKETVKERSQKLRQLTSQTTLPSHQKRGKKN